MPHASILAAAMVSIAVAACAAPASGPADNDGEMRVLVKLLQPSDDAEAIARAASAASGVPVRYLTAGGPPWHALALRCGDASACSAALARLRADTRTYAAVQRDERRRIVSP